MNTSGTEKLSKHLAGMGPDGLVSVYLFGSEAEGRSHRESDIDLGVLLARDRFGSSRARFEERLRFSADLAEVFPGREIDIVILNDAPPQLARRIVTGGRRVFCSDEEADLDFTVYVLQRAADLEPFLQRMRRIKLEALGRP